MNTRSTFSTRSIRRMIRLSHDPSTGRVDLRVMSATAEPRLWFDRAQLRELCDLLHDYADQLDRADREAARATRRNDGMNERPGAAVPNGPRSTAHDATARRTHRNPGGGRGVDAFGPSTLGASTGSEHSVPVAKSHASVSGGAL
jgi:hypothetical protein